MFFKKGKKFLFLINRTLICEIKSIYIFSFYLFLYYILYKKKNKIRKNKDL
jgi:hypothetical protein